MIREKFNELKYTFSKLKVNEIRSNLYETEHEKNLFTPKIEEIEKNLLELEKNDIEYKRIRYVEIYLIFQLMKINMNQ